MKEERENYDFFSLESRHFKYLREELYKYGQKNQQRLINQQTQLLLQSHYNLSQ
ncbi:unnamed protein product [Paramecium sonneborni]|uniref:Uncharacterized protein n=1 Tax=Paramecium sonneborni TaxID=65129 RepID=A0A8S1JWP6_9CILI|nr:unnamed protein product [Paramecium sonneborni]